VRQLELYLLLKNRKRARLQRQLRNERALGVLARAVVATLAIFMVGSLLAIAFAYARFSRDLPSIQVLPLLMDRQAGELLQPTRVLDRSGETTLFTYQDEESERRFLSIDPMADEFISPQLVRAVIAAFDPAFWTSPGYQLKEWRDPEPRTIAERVVSDLILWDEKPSTTRAFRMRLLAGQVVTTYSRTSIIEWYLNSAWFGRYAYGAESAAQLYLGKSVSELTLAEAALLTAVLRSPALNPIDAPATALEGQKVLLKEMLSNGTINQQEYDLATREVITLRESQDKRDTIAEAFIRQVEKQLEPRMGIHRLQRGGLVVITTLDADLQEQLVCTATTQLTRVQYSNLSGVAPEGLACKADLLLPTQSFSGVSGDGLAAAGLIMSPGSGEVLAYLEPLTLTGDRLNDSGYQPGSLLTPLVAFSAFTRGYSPASLVWDIPSSSAGSTSDVTAYQGAVNLRGALANNYLNPITRILNEIGAGNVWRSGVALGLRSLETAPEDGTILFSGAETSLFQLGTAFSTFANSGVRSGSLNPDTGVIEPQTVLRVGTTSGKVIFEQESPQRSTIMEATLAYLINHVLSDESARWPSLGYPNELEIGNPVAAKTASANDDRQVWTLGYDANRLVLIWMGSRGSSGSPLDVHMPAGIWHALFKYATRESRFNGWEKPPGITEMKVCSPSGMLPTDTCPTVVTDVFLYGNEPTMTDTLYIKAKVNRETGALATVFTPAGLVEERTYLNVPPEAREWADKAGLEVVPQGYDAIQLIVTDPQVNISQPALFSAVAGRVNIRGTAAIDEFDSYQVQVGEGINPETWLQVGATSTREVNDGLLAVWDTATLDGLYAIRLSVIDRNNRIRTSLTQVTVDNTPPQVSITYPLAGAEVEAVRGGVTLSAAVEDLVGISKVEWWADGKLALTQTAPPFVYQLRATSGKHTAYLKAWDTAGNQVTSDKIAFQIKP